MTKWWIGLFLVLCFACVKPVQKEKIALDEPDQPTAPFFQTDSIHMFNAQIDAFGKQIRGILVAKKMENKSLRLVLIPKSGPTIFDAEFHHGKFKMVQAIPQLRSAPVRKLLEKDFKLLFFAPQKEDAACQRFMDNEYCRYQMEGVIKKATYGPVQHPIITLSYAYDSTNVPAKVVVEHAQMPLTFTYTKWIEP